MKINIVLLNIFTDLINLGIKRDNCIILFGSWMGQRFSDNPRYLFQYLYFNKKKLGLKKIIWVTHNRKVYYTLKNMGYKVYMMNNPISIYYHLKAGIHIICNQPGKDLLPWFSLGAKRIQLWHGVALKACARMSNYSNREIAPSKCTKNNIKEKIKKTKFYNRYFFSSWNNYYFLTTGQKNRFNSQLDYNFLRKEYFFESNYPRNCECLRMTSHEKRIVNMFLSFDKIILYAPTFRKDYSHYQYPNLTENIKKDLTKNNWLWIEKLHGAYSDANLSRKKTDEVVGNVLYLSSEFDLNVILQSVDLVITDYSSIIFDSVLRYKKLIYYIPDYEYYRDEDRGFMFDYESVTPGPKVYFLRDLYSTVVYEMNHLEMSEKIKNIYDELNKVIWEHSNKHYMDIWQDILNLK